VTSHEPLHRHEQREADQRPSELVEVTPGSMTAPVVGRAFRGGGDPLGGTTADDSVTAALQRRRGGGARLPGDVAELFGAQLGADLGNVRIHTDAEADGIARSVQSIAFTHGSDIYFTQGAYSATSERGQHTLAHELTHVVQQSKSSSAPTSGATTIGRADDPAEAEAERVAQTVVPALRRAAATVPYTPTAAASDVQRLFGFGKKKVKAPAQGNGGGRLAGGAPVLSAKDQFAAALGNNVAAPGSPAEAKQRLVTLKALVKGMSSPDKQSIWSDDALMADTRTFLGGVEYMGFAAAIGMTHTGGTVAHKSGAEVDELIMKYLGAKSHLKSYVKAAVKAGKQAEGSVAVMDDANWNRVYQSEFPKEPVGSKAERRTNAFTSTEQSDSPVILNKNRGNAGTAVHEGMHRYQSDNLLNQTNAPFNEAFDEYFTRKVTSHPDLNIARDNYEDNYDFLTKHLGPLLGSSTVAQEKVMAAVFFGGEVDKLKNAFLKFRTKTKKDSANAAAKEWTRLVRDVRKRDWVAAAARCKP